MALTVQNADHEGLTYFLFKANAMSLEKAKNVLNFEITRCDLFCGAWNLAEAIFVEKMVRFPNHNWNRMPRECYIALTCYTLTGPCVGRRLNSLCCVARPTEMCWHEFPYKSLWCFLLRAFEMLPPFATRCLFRRVRRLCETRSDRMLYSQFVSASLSFDAVYHYARTNGVHIFFNPVPPLLVRDISLYSKNENDQEVLIWPFCTFKVSAIGIGVYSFDFCWDCPPRHLPQLAPTWF